MKKESFGNGRRLLNAKQLSRDEMKHIVAGDSCNDACSGSCTFSTGDAGTCRLANSGTCYCASGGGGKE